jgi:hypothetical protein
MRAKSGNGPRVALVRCARLAAFLLFAFLLAALAGAWIRAGRILEGLDRRTDSARERLATALRANHGLDFYASLDERIPQELITGLPLVGSGAVRVPGVFGSGRRFDGQPGENLVAALQRWAPFAHDGFTLAFWTRFPADIDGAERRLVCDRVEKTGFCLRLVDGRLEASFCDASGLRVLSASVPVPGRYFHVAFVLGTQRAALFVNGQECDACEVAPPIALRPHHIGFGTDGHFPPSMDVDEWCVWRRPLDAGEIAHLARARHPIPELLEPGLSKRLRQCESRANAFRSLVETMGALRSPVLKPAVFNPEVPVLELRLSAGDRRHFREAHLEALASGFRTKRGSRVRRVQASFGGRTERIAAWLDQTVPSLRLSSRPAFVLASENELFGNPSGIVRLFPPEQYGERRPDAARPLPLDASFLVRLHLDGDFLGFYCLVPFEETAPPWFVTGARDIARPDRLHFALPSSVPADGAWLSEAERETAWRRMLDFLDDDPGFPLLPPEAQLLAKRHGAMREKLLLPAPAPGPGPLLGGNPSAFYVTQDLDLAAAGPDVLWRSSDPSAITPEGRVIRPEGSEPRFVELTAERPDGTSFFSCRFRVMPREPSIPALFLFFGRPLEKLARTDFACLRIPAGKDAGGEWLSGTAHGGAKLRGNTSFLKGRRRSINLKFDEPTPVPGADEPVRHLLLLSGYADPTRLRNALSFEAFRAMGTNGPVRAVPVAWTEVFVNGAYAGVWECCPRLQDVLSESFSELYKVRSPDGLWLSPQASADAVDRMDKQGGGDGDDPYAPFLNLVEFVSGADSTTFVGRVEETFDLDELIDFFLLVNFTGNQDGRVTNQFIGRRADDGRWVLLPWDYDKTFLALAAMDTQKCKMIVSPLFRRLFKEFPHFRERVAHRWHELRAGPLSETALDAWIADHATKLAPCMEEDYRVVPPLGFEGDFTQAVDELRTEVKLRLDHIDRFCAERSNIR